ncbi:MAG: iron ABC transporter permease [Alphaproteobacteria bacterium]|nr:iron ABC transporter permease [Alphaproteobacteria bacterium]
MSVDLRSIWTWLSLALLALLVVFMLYPVANIFYGSFGVDGGKGSGWATLIGDPKYVRAIGNTILLGVLVTIAALAVGVPLAYLSARYDFPGKGIVSILPIITLVTPEVIVAQTWLMLLGNNGLLRRWLLEVGVTLPSFYGWFGLVAAMTFIYYTYAYIGTLAAIRGFDVQLEEAAQSLGTSPVRSRWKVLLPVVLPSVLASALLIFTLVVGNFALAMILGGRVELLSVMTYQAAVSETSANPVLQSTLASVSTALVMIVLFAQRWIVSRGRFEVTQGRVARPARLSGLAAGLFALVGGAVVLISLMPLMAVIAGAFTRARGPVMRWGEWTTANLERVLINAPGPMVNTLTYAAAATAIAIVLSALLGYLIVKRNNALTMTLDYLTAIPLALSGTALGIGLIHAFNGGWLPLTGTAAIIVLAYIIRRLPFGLRNASSTLYNIPRSIEEASVSLGVPPGRTFLRVVLPLMVPALAAAAVLTWTTTVAELSASIIVYSGGRETMPIQIFKLIDSNLMAQASAYGLILIAVIVVPIVVATKLFRVDLFSSRS